MRTNHKIAGWLMLAALFALNYQPSTAFAQGTAFSYQGRLNDGGSPANGIYDLRFTLCDAVTNGNAIGALTNTATGVTNGLFMVTLDFGGVFSGSNYWLEIAARTNGGSAFSTLSPRQPITPTPYAIYSATANSANTAATATTASSAASVPASGIGAGTANMAAVLVAKTVGGDVFYGFISAVAFATILAVVAGLTLSGASAVSHDLYASVFFKGRVSERDEIRVSKITTVVLGIVSIFLGIAFENQNVAFMVGLAFVIAASANFPILLMSMFWKRMTTRGAVMGGWIGLVSSVVMLVLGPTVWVTVLGNKAAIIPYDNPGIFTITLSFVAIWFFSITDNSQSAKDEQRAFDAQYIRSQTGLGAEGASAH